MTKHIVTINTLTHVEDKPGLYVSAPYVVEVPGTNERFYTLRIMDRGRTARAKAVGVKLYEGKPSDIVTRHDEMRDFTNLVLIGDTIRLNGHAFEARLGPWRELELRLEGTDT